MVTLHTDAKSSNWGLQIQGQPCGIIKPLAIQSVLIQAQLGLEPLKQGACGIDLNLSRLSIRVHRSNPSCSRNRSSDIGEHLPGVLKQRSLEVSQEFNCIALRKSKVMLQLLHNTCTQADCKGEANWPTALRHNLRF